MPNRVIKDSVRQSEQIDSLTWFQEVVFYRLIVTVDDYGRYYANPQLIRSELFPLKEDLAKKDITAALDRLEELGLIRRYTVDGKPYLEFTKWRKHQQTRATRSKFPVNDNHPLSDEIDRSQIIPDDINGSQMIPDDINGNQMISDDINRNQMKSDDSNGYQMSPKTKSNTNTKTKTKNARAREDIYPKAGVEYPNAGTKSAREDIPSPSPFISDEEARAIAGDQNEILNAMGSIGLANTEYNRNRMLDLYGKYSKEAVLYGISEAGRLNKVSIAYIEGVAKKYGEPKPGEGRQFMSDEEEQEIVSSLVW